MSDCPLFVKEPGEAAGQVLTAAETPCYGLTPAHLGVLLAHYNSRTATTDAPTASVAGGLPTLLRVDQAAAILDVEPDTVRRWARSGHLPALKIGLGRGADLRIAQDDLASFLAAARRAGGRP